jgi:hypothetical protein
MLDIRYIIGSLIITVAVVAFAISLVVPIDRNQNASLKPRIEPSKIATERSAPKSEPVKQTAAPAPAVNAAPAPKQAIAPAQTPAQPAPKQATAPAKTQTGTAPEITGTIAEPKPAPRRVAPAPARKKDEPEFGFQWPWLKGWQQN